MANLTLLQTLARQNQQRQQQDELAAAERMNDARIGASLASQALPAWQTGVGTMETAAQLQTQRDEGAANRGSEAMLKHAEIASALERALLQEEGATKRLAISETGESNRLGTRLKSDRDLAQMREDGDNTRHKESLEAQRKIAAGQNATRLKVAQMGEGAAGVDPRLTIELMRMYGGLAKEAAGQKAFSQAQIKKRAEEAQAWAQKAVDEYEKVRGVKMDPVKKKQAVANAAAKHMQNLLQQDEPAGGGQQRRAGAVEP